MHKKALGSECGTEQALWREAGRSVGLGPGGSSPRWSWGKEGRRQGARPPTSAAVFSGGGRPGQGLAERALVLHRGKII